MSGQKTNNAILAVIAVVLIGILGILVYKNFIEKTPEEKIADSISDTVEDIGNAVSGGKN
jgi:hypothetical protein